MNFVCFLIQICGLGEAIWEVLSLLDYKNKECFLVNMRGYVRLKRKNSKRRGWKEKQIKKPSSCHYALSTSLDAPHLSLMMISKPYSHIISGPNVFLKKKQQQCTYRPDDTTDVTSEATALPSSSMAFSLPAELSGGL